VLLAGQDGPYLRALRALLVDAGLSAHATAELAAMPRVAEQIGADLVVLDFGPAHPEQSGLALVALRHSPATATLPVIATAPAAWLLEERAELFSRHRARAWPEPCDLTGLLGCIESALAIPSPAG
jgi:hypothetical protein